MGEQFQNRRHLDFMLRSQSDGTSQFNCISGNEVASFYDVRATMWSTFTRSYLWKTSSILTSPLIRPNGIDVSNIFDKFTSHPIQHISTNSTASTIYLMNVCFLLPSVIKPNASDAVWQDKKRIEKHLFRKRRQRTRRQYKLYIYFPDIKVLIINRHLGVLF